MNPAPKTAAAQPELEVKLRVPGSARAALREAIAAQPGWSAPVVLEARYFDTPKRRLACAGMALRVRREGRRWVQVLKAAQPGELARDEFATLRPQGTPDLEALGSTPAAALLRSEGEALVLRYETRVRRRTRRVRTRWGVVEIAFDEGWIGAGERRVPVLELEFERVSGQARAVFELARRWLSEFGLVLDPRTKAERGDALAEGDVDARARRAERVTLRRSMDAHAAFRVVLHECADQIQRNAADLALGVGGDEHVHQLRVGLRRLRTAWRLFDGECEAAPAELVDGARRLFARMGEARDAAVASSEIDPMLVAAGMPVPVPRPAPDAIPPQRWAADPGTQRWLVDLLAWIETVRAPEPGRPFASVAARRLRRWHARLVGEAAGFAELDDARRHDVRKRAKRLRYATEFCRALLGSKSARAALERLALAQQALGEVNDLVVARERHAAAVHTDPAAAWFARGWIAARLEHAIPRARAALLALGKARARRGR